MSLSPAAFQKFDLTGRRAVVTGGGTGMGYDIARGLARSGADVHVDGMTLVKKPRAKN